MIRMITTRRRAYAILGLVLVGLVVFISETTLLHPCDTCGKEMRPFEEGSSVYRCECGFMVDAGFQR
jgi:predicted RNA-binding Zn-ribbon protein involved in translation (DUF1610 family)